MKLVRTSIIALGIFYGLLLQPGWAEIFHWTDENGISHFTDDINSVPEQYLAPNLIEFPGADSSMDANGWTPLHIAVMAGDLEEAEWVISQGADVHSYNVEGVTPLHLAVELGHTGLVELLLRQGADPESMDQYGLSPLQMAIDDGRTELLPLLKKKEEKKESDPKEEAGVYDEVARATGGAVYKFDEGLEGAGDIMIATYGSEILVSETFELYKETKTIRVPIEASVTMVLFTVTALQGKPAAEITDPLGTSLKDYLVRKPQEVKEISLENGEAIIVHYPEPGMWKLKVSGTGNLHVKVDIKSDKKNNVSFDDFEFVELRGRPGHQGYFKTFRPLAPGQEMKAKATLFGSPQDVRVEFIRSSGDSYPGYGGRVIPEAKGSNSYYGDFKIPPNSFRVMMTGKDKDGNPLQRLFNPLFEIDHDITAFHFKKRLTLKDCANVQWLLSLPLAKKKLTRKMSAKEIVLLSCPVENKKDSYDFDMSIYALPPENGESRQVIFLSDERMRLTKAKCGQALNLLERFASTKRGKKADASWKAECMEDQNNYLLVMDLTISSKTTH